MCVVVHSPLELVEDQKLICHLLPMDINDKGGSVVKSVVAIDDKELDWHMVATAKINCRRTWLVFISIPGGVA